MNNKTVVLADNKVIGAEETETSRSPFSLQSRLKSFSYAWEGIAYFFNTEANAKIHLAITFTVIISCFFFRVNRVEVIALCFSIAFVWVAEMINTAIERSMDLISLEKRPQIKIIKDIAAGAVLVASVCAAIVGAIIFIPKLFML